MAKIEHVNKKQIIMNSLLSDIHNGLYRPGDMIPSELELSKKYGFGRQTVHNALYGLSLQGIITRTRGKGSFVAYHPTNRNIRKKMSFSDDMHSVGMTPGSELLEFKIVSAVDYPDVVSQLNISGDTKLYFVKRLRTGNGIPIAIQYHYLPVDFLPNIELDKLNGSIDQYIEQRGIVITGFSTRLRAVEGSTSEKGLLQTSSSALLRSISIRFISDTKPFQYTCTLYRSDLYEYTFSSFD